MPKSVTLSDPFARKPMLSLFPHQITGVQYLKSRAGHALLWDEQRVGKTPQAIIASGELGLDRVLVITTVSGVGVWRHQWRQWDRWQRSPVVLPWSKLNNGSADRLLHETYDLLILDEGHLYKSFSAARTRRVYGMPHGHELHQEQAIMCHAGRVWHLTGTPAPHDPGDLYPCLRALFPKLLAANPKEGLPDVGTFEKFRSRYCVMVNKRIKNRVIKVVVRGQNLDELKRRLKGQFLRRRQSEVGIRPAFWDLLPVEISDSQRAKMFSAIDMDAIRRAARTHDIADLEPLLAPVRRITGIFKAHAVADDAADFLDVERDQKLVVAYWHKDVGDVLYQQLHKYGVARVDGSITGSMRDLAIRTFQHGNQCRVFLAQIAACGEAIDLSAASEMWFAESTFTPSQMAQMGARITNLNQPKQCLVRVAALEGTIDEVIQDRLVNLARSIAQTLGETYNENFAQHRV